MSNHPFDEVVIKMNRLAGVAGNEVYLKFTCARCGARQTSDAPNAIHVSGYTCEECGGLTTLDELRRDGINFLLVMHTSPKKKEA